MQEKIEEAGCVPIAEKKEKRGEIKRGGEKGGGGHYRGNREAGFLCRCVLRCHRGSVQQLETS